MSSAHRSVYVPFSIFLASWFTSYLFCDVLHLFSLTVAQNVTCSLLSCWSPSYKHTKYIEYAIRPEVMDQLYIPATNLKHTKNESDKINLNLHIVNSTDPNILTKN